MSAVIEIGDAEWTLVEDLFDPPGREGRWRRLSRCYEGSAASDRAWLEVAAVAYLFARIRVKPA